VITGGPGTGKTYAIARLLALQAALNPARPPRALLTAPTGKAAARLNESLQADRSRPLAAGPSGPVLAPPEVGTLHRLLGPVRGSPYFRHNRANPLAADLVIVDEASMVDLALMAKLVDALKPDARLVLVGDKDQLSSVEAGSVLGDICNRSRHRGFSAAMAAALSRLTGSEIQGMSAAAPGLRDSIVELHKSYRFAPGSAIGDLGRAVNAGDFGRAAGILDDPGSRSVRWLDPENHPHAVFELEKIILEGYQGSFAARDPQEALNRQADFKILCAHKAGPLGAEGLNRRAEALLLARRVIRPADMRAYPWYSGRPVMVTRNDYNQGLFNGDLGVCTGVSAGPSGLFAVYFANPAGGIRQLDHLRLPEHETVYAMTVHKSQGSEYAQVLLVLPERDSPVLTRELIYTALTRARETFTLYGRRGVLQAALSRRIERASGLRDALWGSG
jgi:exodeoxyribonuclease V alpha subunit